MGKRRLWRNTSIRDEVSASRAHGQNPARKVANSKAAVRGNGLKRAATCVSACVASKSNIASLNVQGGLSFPCTDKIIGLLAQCEREHIGILAMQETHVPGNTRREISDMYGQTWAFCSGGMPNRREQGTGFIVSDKQKVISFRAYSPRLSMIAVTPVSGSRDKSSTSRHLGGGTESVIYHILLRTYRARWENE